MSERYSSAIPKYNFFDYKAGRCTDLEYYQSVYAGPDGVATKHFDPKDTKKEHPFFVIKRNKTVNFWGEKVAEYKVYDKTRGLLSKEEHLDVTNRQYWAEYKKTYAHMSYVEFLGDTFAIVVPDPRKKAKKAKAKKQAKKNKTKAKAAKTAK